MVISKKNIEKSTPYNFEKKRNRTKMNNKQFSILREAFIKDIFPHSEKRKELANQLGLPQKTIQIWFQNQRQRAKIIEDEFKNNIIREILDNNEIKGIPEELIPLEILSSISTMELKRIEWNRKK